MLHGTLSTSSSPSVSATAALFLIPSFHFSSLRTPRPAPVPPLAYSHCSQGEKESNMEVVNANLRPEILCSGQQKQQNQVALSEEVGWAVERGNIMGEAFSVDDLLNLGAFVEDEMEAEEEEAGRVSQIDAQQAHNETTHSSSSSSSSSGLTFELPPPLSDICLPAHDAAELEWVSFIIDDSISEFPSCSGVASLSSPPSGAQSENRQVRAAEPQGQGLSFLVPNVCPLSTEAKVPVKAKRSKRSRGATAAWSMSGPLSLADSSSCSSATTTTSSASSCSSTSSSSPFLIYDPSAVAVDQSFLLYDHPPQPKKQKPKKRGRKPKTPLSTASGERRCSHCGAQKTPQWRAGPLGAKTLCNACGVRFKSGRLLPEYRPACSPTFVSHMHSNSHRKVLEMRRTKEAELLAPATSPPPPLLVAVSL
ncbi:GATA transcription factor [Musa troglodytarum]|uniref:GATA transcription factor n=1 Tax=Musa troglodytarum TaxID=320322 RepID=A0A9E7FGV7_9LILI|nr:GATA transcription factor [Musa troglodytarum]URD99893.1 GATA transcription factor [Musa troglodytarum]